ncbi:PilT protein domain-containing protein [Salinisphaera sp. PC39]|uniref:type II toxin-antitoxin system VapC family toxin n=1 Tax=Salinisphaera sp. PC39 TaxID=1304156 RepID=UPI003342D110
MRPALLDTDVLIDYLRGITPAVQYLESMSQPALISAVTVGELFVGARDADEETKLDRFINTFDVLPVTHEIARLGGLFRCQYRNTHGTGLADAFIAATAVEYEAHLMTFNLRHYPMVDGANKPYKRPT